MLVDNLNQEIKELVQAEKRSVKNFLLHKTKVGELCVIRDSCWIVATCWIDAEDLFVIPPRYADREVKSDSWGLLTVVDEIGTKNKVPCHFIDV